MTRRSKKTLPRPAASTTAACEWCGLGGKNRPVPLAAGGEAGLCGRCAERYEEAKRDGGFMVRALARKVNK